MNPIGGCVGRRPGAMVEDVRLRRGDPGRKAFLPEVRGVPPDRNFRGAIDEARGCLRSGVEPDAAEHVEIVRGMSPGSGS